MQKVHPGKTQFSQGLQAVFNQNLPLYQIPTTLVMPLTKIKK